MSCSDKNVFSTEVSDMSECKLRLADVNILVKHPLQSSVFASCKEYYSSFLYPDMIINISYSDILKSCLNYIKEVNTPDLFTTFPKVNFVYNENQHAFILAQEMIADRMISFNTILMHGSVVALDKQAYMFAAPSGVGKTTRTRLWRDLYTDTIVINGDKPLIKVTETGIIACGTPWCGKEGWNANIMVPLRAIFLLERAEEGEESSIEEVSLGKAFPFLLQQTHRPEDLNLMKKTLQLLKCFEGKVKIYSFRSAPTKESVRLAYETARFK